MRRILTDGEVHELLEKECYGHLACRTEEDRLYLVPIAYVYHENALYSFSFPGMKVDAMRVHPDVCFQIDKLHEPERWRSAIVWGTFEELTGKDAKAAYSLILERLWLESSRDHPIFLPFRHSAEALEAAKDDKNIVLYRINIQKTTGRMEEYD